MSVLQSAATYANLFAGTNTYTRTGLSAPSAGQGVIVCVQSEGTRSITGVVLSSSGTTTALSSIGSVANQCYIFAGTATGSETNSDIVVTASGSVASDTGYGVLVVDSWSSNQAAADVETLITSGTTFDTPAVNPTTANNLIVVAADRGNRTWTEDADFTMLTTGDARWGVGYIVQSASTSQGHTMIADTSTAANVVLVAFVGDSNVLTWLPSQQVGTGPRASMVPSGMTPPNRVP